MYDTDDPNLGGGSTGPVSNPGSTGSWQTLLQYDLSVARACRVQALANYKQSYNQAGQGWATQLLIDGTVVQESWGGAPLDSVVLLGAMNVDPGQHEVKLLWQANTSNIQALNPRMSVTWTYK